MDVYVVALSWSRFRSGLRLIGRRDIDDHALLDLEPLAQAQRSLRLVALSAPERDRELPVVARWDGVERQRENLVDVSSFEATVFGRALTVMPNSCGFLSSSSRAFSFIPGSFRVTSARFPRRSGSVLKRTVRSRERSKAFGVADELTSIQAMAQLSLLEASRLEDPSRR